MLKFAVNKICESSTHVEDSPVAVPQLIKKLDDVAFLASNIAEFIMHNDNKTAQMTAMKVTTDLQGIITELRGGKSERTF
jgi:hypothetical protein